jgi:hypothetical protein
MFSVVNPVIPLLEWTPVPPLLDWSEVTGVQDTSKTAPNVSDASSVSWQLRSWPHFNVLRIIAPDDA